MQTTAALAAAAAAQPEGTAAYLRATPEVRRGLAAQCGSPPAPCTLHTLHAGKAPGAGNVAGMWRQGGCVARLWCCLPGTDEILAARPAVGGNRWCGRRAGVPAVSGVVVDGTVLEGRC